MAWTLYRYITMELLRVIGLTTAVLVTVIAFGFTIKPLTGDRLLDAEQTFRLLLLAIVPTLQYALPFAAGFGATLVMHRMTSDNEIQAMAVSGMSYRKVLAPVATLGIMLTLVMVVLTQYVIPRFFSAIEQMLTTDATTLFAAAIRRGDAFHSNRVQIYAADIVPETAPQGPGGPDSRLFLLKVAAALMDDSGRIVTDVTASQAAVDVYRRDGRTILKLVMKDAMGFNPQSGLGGVERGDQTFMLPGAMRDTPKAMTQGQLRAMLQNPDEYAQVIEARMTLAETLQRAETKAALHSQLRSSGRVELMPRRSDDQTNGRWFLVHAAKLQADQLLPPDGGHIEVLEHDKGAAVRRFITQSATLTTSAGLAPDEPAFDLTLGAYEVVDLHAGGPPNQRAGLVLPALRLAKDAAEMLDDLPSAELIRRAQSVRDGGEPLNAKILAVNREIEDMRYGIISHLMNRYALSFTAFLLLCLGATLAVWLRHSQPLTVYAFAFLPAILDLILISAGQQLIRDGQMMGHAVMWSGSGLTLALLLFAFLKLARH